jgi:peptidylprolyl isomerase
MNARVAVHRHVAFALAAVAASTSVAAAAAPTIDEVLRASPASEWRTLEPADTLYLDLAAGRVVIELAPAFAPHAVAAIRAYVRSGYFDGAGFMRAQDNYVVQWGRADDDPRAQAEGSRRLEAEFFRPLAALPAFTRLADPDAYAPEVGYAGGFPVGVDRKRSRAWMVHCYGAVGVGRDNAPDSGNGTELYAVIGHAPRNLDRNVTLVGRVVQGMELLSVMPRGPAPMGFYEKREQWSPIAKATLAADLPAEARLPLEALRTDSRTFATVLAMRRTRREPWFQDPVGHIGVCNMPLPVRTRPAKPPAG